MTIFPLFRGSSGSPSWSVCTLPVASSVFISPWYCVCARVSECVCAGFFSAARIGRKLVNGASCHINVPQCLARKVSCVLLSSFAKTVLFWLAAQPRYSARDTPDRAIRLTKDTDERRRWRRVWAGGNSNGCRVMRCFINYFSFKTLRK